MTRKLR